MKPTKNFSEYRKALHSATPPCIPFVGVYLTDLTFVHDGHKSTFSIDAKEYINFQMHCKTADILKELKSYQMPYHLIKIPEIQQVLKKRLETSQPVSQLYSTSLNLEPRDEQEKLTRLFQATGFL